MATLALILSGLAVVRSQPVSLPPAPASSGDTAALRREIDDLKKRASEGRGGADPAMAEALRRLTKRVEALESARPPGAAGSVDPDSDAPAAVSAGATTTDKAPLYSSLVVPQKGVTVKDMGGGALSVTNTDPSLTGQRVTIAATRVDGTSEEVHIVVPPPSP